MELMTILEIVGVALGFVYVTLAIRRHISCWLASYIASGLFVVVFLDAGLIFQPWLQVFYMVMAVYGYRKWRRGAKNPATLGYWGWRNNLIAVAALLAVSIPIAIFGAQYSESSLFFIDVVTALAAPLATFMQARKYIGNWIWWMVLDSIYVALYLERGLYFTAVLFASYLVLAWVGYRSWRKALPT
ncbi:MAG: nicotinamide mononucleotide transporter [Chromatiales bacterium]|nr:nicotinamide mononucleotide transporter [Chromatiales bacterium]